MRTPYANSGQYDSNRSLNRPRVADHKAHLPVRSSAQVFAQQSAQDSSLKRPSPRFNQNARPTVHISGDQRLFNNRRERSISPTGALPFNPHAGGDQYQADRFFPEATAPRHSASYERNAPFEASAPNSNMFYEHSYEADYRRGYGCDSSYNAAAYADTSYESSWYGQQDRYTQGYTGAYGAPSAAVAVPRPARTPAGYMPYTQTTNMGKNEQASGAPGTPSAARKTQPPISFIDDDFPAGSGGSAIAPDVYPPDFDQDVAGAGTETGTGKDIGTEVVPLDKKRKADNPQKDRFRKNLKYGEYLSVPQGKKAIFTDNSESHNRTLLWMGIILVALIVAAIAVWTFV